MAVFFVDRCLGSKFVPARLRAAGHEVVAHDEEFGPGTEDVEWIAAAGANDWIALTKDERIRRRPAEQEAIRRAGAAVFVVRGKDLPAETVAQAILAAMQRIQAIAASHTRPLIATVSRSGVVEVIEGQRRGSVHR